MHRAKSLHERLDRTSLLDALPSRATRLARDDETLLGKGIPYMSVSVRSKGCGHLPATHYAQPVSSVSDVGQGKSDGAVTSDIRVMDRI